MAKLFENTNKTCSIIKDCDFCTEMTKIEKKLSEYVTRGYFETFDGNKMEYEFYKVAQNMYAKENNKYGKVPRNGLVFC